MRRGNEVRVVEVVMRGEPPPMHAGPGKGFHISPNPRKVSELKDHHIAVKRLFSAVEKSDNHVVLNDPRVVKLLQDHMEDGIQRAIGEAKKELREEMRKEMNNFLDSQNIETLKQLTNSRTIRCLLDVWLKSKEGKAALSVMNKVTRSGNVVHDIKTCIRLKDEKKLQKILLAIDGVSNLPGGQGFVDLMVGYMDANLLIHKKLSPIDLNIIREKVASGYNYGLGEASNQWLTIITSDLLRGWVSDSSPELV